MNFRVGIFRVGIIKKSAAMGLALVIFAACATAAPGDTAGAPAAGTAPAATPAPAGTAETAAEPQYDAQAGGEATWITAAFPPSLDPHIPSDTTSRDVIRQIMEPLLAFGPGDVIEYRLATSFENLDPVTWQFNLRQGVTFHDGAPFNSEAVYLTFNRMLDPENAKPRRLILEMIEEVVIIDDYTVNLITTVPFGPFPAQLTNFAASILSPLAIAEEEAGGRVVALNPVGTGPFQVADIVPGEYVRIERFDDYWGDIAYLDSVVFRTVPDPATRMLMLQAGETNGMLATVADIFALETMTGVDFVLHPSMAMHFIGMNTSAEPFNDIRVRHAVSMAVNLDDILHGVMESHGFLAQGPIHPAVAFSPFHDVQRTQRDVEAARTLIQEAGIYGRDISFVYFTGDATRTHIAQVVQANLAEIGLNVNISSMEWAAFLQDVTAGNSEMFTLSWANSTGDADGSVHALFHSDSIGAVNRTFFNNPQADALINAGRSETNASLRYGIYRELVELLIYEAPMVFMFHPYSPFATYGIDGLFLDITGVPYFQRVTLR